MVVLIFLPCEQLFFQTKTSEAYFAEDVLNIFGSILWQHRSSYWEPIFFHHMGAVKAHWREECPPQHGQIWANCLPSLVFQSVHVSALWCFVLVWWIWAYLWQKVCFEKYLVLIYVFFGCLNAHEKYSLYLFANTVCSPLMVQRVRCVCVCLWARPLGFMWLQVFYVAVCPVYVFLPPLLSSVLSIDGGVPVIDGTILLWCSTFNGAWQSKGKQHAAREGT